MKKQHITIFLTAALLLAAAACMPLSAAPAAGDAQYAVYYAAKDLSAVGGEDAIVAEYVTVPNADSMTPEALGAVLLRYLMEDSAAQQTATPIPTGTALLDISLQGRRLTVDFSSAYSRLSGVDLSLADYCVTLTLTQLSGVDSVRISVLGQELPYRDRQIFYADDALLSSTEDTVRTFSATLYFWQPSDQSLAAEERLITLREGDTRLANLLAALREGPQTEGYEALLPEGFEVLSVRSDENVCYLNLPASVAQSLPEDAAAQQLLMESIVRSVCALDTVDSVQILLDGEMRDTLGSLLIGTPLQPNELYQ